MYYLFGLAAHRCAARQILLAGRVSGRTLFVRLPSALACVPHLAATSSAARARMWRARICGAPHLRVGSAVSSFGGGRALAAAAHLDAQDRHRARMAAAYGAAHSTLADAARPLRHLGRHGYGALEGRAQERFPWARAVRGWGHRSSSGVMRRRYSLLRRRSRGSSACCDEETPAVAAKAEERKGRQSTLQP